MKGGGGRVFEHEHSMARGVGSASFGALPPLPPRPRQTSAWSAGSGSGAADPVNPVGTADSFGHVSKMSSGESTGATSSSVYSAPVAVYATPVVATPIDPDKEDKFEETPISPTKTATAPQSSPFCEKRVLVAVTLAVLLIVGLSFVAVTKAGWITVGATNASTGSASIPSSSANASLLDNLSPDVITSTVLPPNNLRTTTMPPSLHNSSQSQITSYTPSSIPPSSPAPTPSPSMQSTQKLQLSQTFYPTSDFTKVPSGPTKVPSQYNSPTKAPSQYPSFTPTHIPSHGPSLNPTPPPTNSPTTQTPSMTPSFLPTTYNTSFNLLESRNLTTTFDGQETFAGNMFHVTSIERNITIEAMTIHAVSKHQSLGDKQLLPIELWTKEGTFLGFEQDAQAWTQIASFNITVPGDLGSPTTIPVGTFPQVPIPAGSTLAFYVSVIDGSGYLVSTNYSGFENRSFSNADIALTVGSSNDYPFSTSVSTMLWNGALQYRLQSP